MNKSKREIGSEAENLACKYLINKGWQIIQRNYYAGHAEIDIIARNQHFFVFIEVKMRTGTKFGTPIEQINEAKVERVFRAAEHWAVENGVSDQPLRFDVIGILSKKNGSEITHLEDAYR